MTGKTSAIPFVDPARARLSRFPRWEKPAARRGTPTLESSAASTQARDGRISSLSFRFWAWSWRRNGQDETQADVASVAIRFGFHALNDLDSVDGGAGNHMACTEERKLAAKALRQPVGESA